MEKVIFDILDNIENNNHQAYVVGGFVRDYLLNKDSFDIDITTDATPKEVLELLNIPNALSYEYGNVYFKYDKYDIEVTTMREEYNYIDGRRPSTVKYINDLKKDLLRRDFTINTICMDKTGKIIDLLDGKKDLKSKIIRMVGDPDVRIKEDALRILRAIRFATILNFKIDKELKLSIKKNKHLLANLSYERKKEELIKIFTNDNKKYGVKLLKELDLVSDLELTNINNVIKTNYITGIYATVFSDNYPMSKVDKQQIKSIKSMLNEDINDRKVLYKYGVYPLDVVCDLKGLCKKKYINIYEKLPIKDRKEINISSNEICEVLKIEPSDVLRDVFEDLESVILNKKIKNTNEEIKKYLYHKYMI